MPHCTNCGGQVQETHHYCGSCGNALSDMARSENETHMAYERDGFLSSRSVSYLADILNGEREIDRESTSHAQLQEEVRAALADFAILEKIEDLNLLLLWASGPELGSLDKPMKELSADQKQEWHAHLGLGRLLKLYDQSLGTDFHDEFQDQLMELAELAEEELDKNENSEPAS